MRRALLAVPLATLLLAGCGSGEPNFPPDSTDAAEAEAGADDGSEAGGTTALDCAEAPEPRTDVPTYSQDDLPEPHAGDTLTATVETNCGDIVLALDAASAPQTVASFEFLAEEGYWDDSPCHRLTTGGIFVLQCGDPTGTGSGSPGYGYGIENAPPDGTYPPGSLAMARTQDPNSNGGQFFIVYADTRLPTEGGGYSVFGQVTDGLEIVEAIAEAGGEGGAPDGPPAQPISILSVDVQD